MLEIILEKFSTGRFVSFVHLFFDCSFVLRFVLLVRLFVLLVRSFRLLVLFVPVGITRSDWSYEEREMIGFQIKDRFH